MSVDHIRGSGRIKLTCEQEEILACPPDNTTRWIAFAGCAKTTTCVEYSHQWKRKALYLAFNAAIAADAKGRFPANVETKTAHAYAFQALDMRRHSRRLVARLRPRDLDPIGEILRRAIWHDDITTRRAFLSTLNVFLISSDQQLQTKHLVGIPTMVRSQALPVFAAAVAVMLDYERHQMPLTHDIYLKVFALNHALCASYDYIFIDEAQDLNPVLIGLIQKSGIPAIIVGDPKQSIYAFRGARNAMSSFDGPVLTLSQSFRFGPRIASAANWLLGHTFTSPDTPVCGLPSINTTIGEYTGILKPPSTVLGRTNMRLFKGLISGKSRFHVIGGIDSLTRMVEAGYYLWSGMKRPPHVFDSVVSIYDSWHSLCDAAENEDDPELSRLVEIIETYTHRIPAILMDLKSRHMGSELGCPLIVSTAHKAKGREWDSVVLMDDFPTIARLNKALRDKKLQPVDYEQEIHLAYVAQTRAKRMLSLPTDLYAEIDTAIGLARQPA